MKKEYLPLAIASYLIVTTVTYGALTGQSFNTGNQLAAVVSSGVTINQFLGPNTLNVGQSGYWSASYSTDANPYVSCSFNFGDNYPTAATKSSLSYNNCSTSHTYSQAGSYYVAVYVNNLSTGQSAYQSMTVNVTNITVSINPGIAIIQNRLKDGKNYAEADYSMDITPTGGSITLHKYDASAYLKDDVTGRASGSYAYSDLYTKATGTTSQDQVELPAGQTTRVYFMIGWDPLLLFGGSYQSHLNGISFSQLGKFIPVSLSSTGNPLLVVGEQSPYISAATSQAVTGSTRSVVNLYGARFNTPAGPTHVFMTTCGAGQCQENEIFNWQVLNSGKQLTFSLASTDLQQTTNLFKVTTADGNSNNFSFQWIEPAGAPSKSITGVDVGLHPEISPTTTMAKIGWYDSLASVGRRNYDLALLKSGKDVAMDWPRSGYDWGCDGSLYCNYQNYNLRSAYSALTGTNNLPAGSDYQIRVCPSGGVPCAKSPNFTIGSTSASTSPILNPIQLCPNGMTLASNCTLAPIAGAATVAANTSALCPNGMTVASSCTQSTTPVTTCPLTHDMKSGDGDGNTDGQVTKLQNFLVGQLGSASIVAKYADRGYYGNNTKADVLSFQKNNPGLPQDGTFGPDTQAKTCSILSASGQVLGASVTNSSCVDLSHNMRVTRSSDSNTDGEVTKLQTFLVGYFSRPHLLSYIYQAQLITFDSSQPSSDKNPHGWFGLRTLSDLKKFQDWEQIPSTGVAGPLTRAKIKNLTCQR